MTPLRKRMIEDMQLRGLSERTQEAYVRAVRQLAAHYHKSPDRITEEDLRDYFLSLKHVKHYSRSASTIALCGITCFYEHTLKRDWSTRSFVRAQREKTLPVILRPQEVRRILQQSKRLRSRVCLPTIYACGLRLQEGTHLQGADIDAARMLVHVRHGKGAKDRSVPLPRRTVELLRHFWTTHRNPVWLFPAPGRGRMGLPTAQTPMPTSSVQDAFRQARTPCGINTRASVHTRRHSYATHLLDAGITLRLMQAYLGHNTPTTTSVSTHRTARPRPWRSTRSPAS